MNRKELKVVLNTIDKVKLFANDISKFEGDFSLVSGRYVIDAKSIMGIFSLDLSKALDLVCEDINEDDFNKLVSVLKERNLLG